MMRYGAEYSTVLDLIKNIYSLLYSILCTYIYIYVLYIYYILDMFIYPTF